MSSLEHSDTINKSDSWQMFNAISKRYDLLNRILSFGLDLSWRKKLVKYIPKRQHMTVLDLATGTADVVLMLSNLNHDIERAYGIDMADEMLKVGRQKIASRKLESVITLQHGDAHQIPFADNYFDAVTIAFGIRNMEHPLTVLHEMRRVLNKGGRAVILEFSLPRNVLIRRLHLFYLRHLVPIIGGMLTDNFRAYRYLNQTIEQFPHGDAFCALMKEAGFLNIRAEQLFCGAASIYSGEKP